MRPAGCNPVHGKSPFRRQGLAYTCLTTQATRHPQWDRKPKYRSALIVGTGPGAQRLARAPVRPGTGFAVAHRRPPDRQARGAVPARPAPRAYDCNAADPKDVAALFEAVEAKSGAPDVVVYNASGRVRGALVDLPPDDVKRAIEISAFGGLPGRPAGRQAHAAARATARSCCTGATAGREGLRAVRDLRHGQVRPARAGAERWRASSAPRASMSRIS